MCDIRVAWHSPKPQCTRVQPPGARCVGLATHQNKSINSVQNSDANKAEDMGLIETDTIPPTNNGSSKSLCNITSCATMAELATEILRIVSSPYSVSLKVCPCHAALALIAIY